MSQFVEEVTGAVFISNHSHARDLGKVNAIVFELSRMRHRYDIEISHRLSVTQKNQGSVADAVDAATLFLKESEIVQTDDRGNKDKGEYEDHCCLYRSPMFEHDQSRKEGGENQ